MNQLEDICCFCLKSSNVSFTDLFTKGGDGLSQFDKVSITHLQLANILKENVGHTYMICCECCDTIEMVRHFNQKCLDSLEIYLSKKTFSVEVYSSNDYRVDIKTELDGDEDGFGISTTSGSPGSFHYEPEIKIETPDEENEKVDPLDVPGESTGLSESCESSSENFFENFDCVAEEKLLGREKYGESSLHKRLFVRGRPSQYDKNETPVCSECGRSFNRIYELIRHLRIHSGEKPYKCVICDKTFNQKDYLNKHILVHSDEKPYQCEICNKFFKQKSSLSIHKLTHTGEKPHNCHYCEKLFSKKSDLNRHLRIHSGEKPYECDVCGRGFTIKSTLTKHKSLHTGAKPFKCNFCEKSYTQKSGLDLHFKIKHQN